VGAAFASRRAAPRQPRLVGEQALAVLILLVAGFAALAAFLLRRRDA